MTVDNELQRGCYLMKRLSNYKRLSCTSSPLITPSGVASLHHGAPGQMTWLEYPTPWLRSAHYFASVMV